ncbi:MAG: hypothetical protein ACREC5_03130, partial [Thermoplasmata archaeon]
MTCRYESDDPRRCDRCGEFLWVVEEGLFCAECGVTMPCTMQMKPPPVTASTPVGPSRAPPWA